VIQRDGLLRNAFFLTLPSPRNKQGQKQQRERVGPADRFVVGSEFLSRRTRCRKRMAWERLEWRFCERWEGMFGETAYAWDRSLTPLCHLSSCLAFRLFSLSLPLFLSLLCSRLQTLHIPFPHSTVHGY